MPKASTEDRGAAHQADGDGREVRVSTPGKVVWDEETDGYTTLPVRLFTIPEWREIDEEKWVELYVPRHGEWRRVKRHWVPVLEGLIDGAPLAECEANLAEARPDFSKAARRHIVRKVVRQLERGGMAELVTPDPPAVFDDRYELVRQLGRGGMGVVWLCRDLDREGDPRVAVKHAWNWKTRFEKAQRYLEEEVDMLARFDHPRIVSLLDTFEIDGRLHMVREFLDGEPLTGLCGEDALTEARRVRFAHQVADTIDAIRREGYLFFDVSPDNYYADPGLGAVTLGDVGVTRPIEDGGVAVRSRVGTRRYAAPEMLGGGRVDERAQVYSLGRLYWHMIMGYIPVARSAVERVHRQNAAIHELLKDSRASQREIDFFEAATRTDPDDRPDTLDDALEILGPPEG